MMIRREQWKNNIILVGFSEEERRRLKIPNIGKIYYLDKMRKLKRYRGFMLIINNVNNIRSVDVDKKYRKYLSRYGRVWLYNEKCNEIYHKWSRIELRNNKMFTHTEKYYWKQYEIYINTLDTKRPSLPKDAYGEKLKKLHKFLKKYKTIKSGLIASYMKISARIVRVYMRDVNDIYNNVGYDYSNNEWYVIK